jgi:hypothetical protein
VKLQVMPELEKVVQAAQEAKITITEVNFVRDTDADILDALCIAVEGKEDAIGYFSFLLEQQKLRTMV